VNKRKSFYLERYANSTHNQMLFDSLDYISLGHDINDFCGLPRPSKWMVRYKIFPNMFKGKLAPLRLLWVYLFGYIYFIISFILGVFSSMKSASEVNYKYGNLALATSQRSINVISEAVGAGNDIIWLNLTNAKVIRELDKVANISSLLSLKDKVDVLFFSFRAHNFIKNKGINNLFFQTYTAYKWYSVVLCLERLNPKKIFTAQHLDRWAILIDSYVESSDLDIEFHLVQHGLELEKTYSYKKNDSKFIKLKNVTHLYVYDINQYNIFENRILYTGLSEKIKLEYFKTKIELYEVGFIGKIKVLFVGHSICEDLHIAMFLALSNSFDFAFYYKPHPTTKMNAKLNDLGWEVVASDNGFPNVDYLVSYESTLVDEYREVGIESFVHEIDAPENKYSKVIDDAIAFFKGIE